MRTLPFSLKYHKAHGAWVVLAATGEIMMGMAYRITMQGIALGREGQVLIKFVQHFEKLLMFFRLPSFYVLSKIKSYFAINITTLGAP